MAKYQWRSFTIPVDGPVVETVHDKQPALEWLQSQVGGYIETVPYFTKFASRTRGVAYCNEDGLFKNLPINRAASIAWNKQYPGGNFLLGPVVITFREQKS